MSVFLTPELRPFLGGAGISMHLMPAVSNIKARKEWSLMDIFLTGPGVVHAGTYFPPSDAYGRPGKARDVPSLLQQFLS